MLFRAEIVTAERRLENAEARLVREVGQLQSAVSGALATPGAMLAAFGAGIAWGVRPDPASGSPDSGRVRTPSRRVLGLLVRWVMRTMAVKALVAVSPGHPGAD